MKKKWFSLIDTFKFPLVLLLVGCILINASNFKTSSMLVTNLLLALKYCGYLIKQLFPLSLIVCYLSTKFEESVSVIVGIIDYIVLEIITLFMCSANLPSYFYNSAFGFSFPLTTVSGSVALHHPVNLGIIASAIIIFCVSSTYKMSRKRYNYGIISFVSNDAWFFFVSTALTIVCGLIAVIGYNIFVDQTIRLFTFISSNSSNPVSLFLYGVTDRIFNVLGLGDVVRKSFLTGNYGGSWIGANGVSVIGDINIWTAQLAANELGEATGRFTTPLYVINLFVVPSIIIGYYLNINDKIEKSKFRGIAILAIICSLFSASVLPVELVLMFTAPALLLIHFVLTGGIYLVTGVLNMYIGYSFTGELEYSSIGNIIDFVNYSNSSLLSHRVLIVALIGLVSFVIYQLVIWLYYHVFVQDFLDGARGHLECRMIIDGLGGINNIKMITSNAISLIVVVNDKELVKSEQLLDGRTFKVRERYFGYCIDYGPGSGALRRLIEKELNSYQEVLEYGASE